MKKDNASKVKEIRDKINALKETEKKLIAKEKKEKKNNYSSNLQAIGECYNKKYSLFTEEELGKELALEDIEKKINSNGLDKKDTDKEKAQLNITNSTKNINNNTNNNTSGYSTTSSSYSPNNSKW